MTHIKNKRFVFLHIPRTGGTSFWRYVSSKADQREILEIFDRGNIGGILDDLKTLRADGIPNDVSFIRGHFSFGQVPQLNDWQSVSLVRDPVERLISYYYYIIKKKKHYLRDYIIDRRIGLNDFLVGDLSAELENFQLKVLSGGPHREYNYRKCEDSLMEIVSRIEDRSLIVGVSEDVIKSMSEVFDLMGGYTVGTDIDLRHNTVSHRHLLSPKTLELVEERNEYDIKLHQYILNRNLMN